jgi:hypothetical protein
LKDILKEGISVSLARERLRERERAYLGGESRRERGKRIAEIFPKEAARTVELAEQALRGMHVLPGMGPEPVSIGCPPVWADNPCGDNEYTFHLNRMEHWKTLCEAYSMTGDERYAAGALGEMENWIDTVPCPPLFQEDGEYNLRAFEGLSCWRALEVGIRGYRTWPFLAEHLLCSPAFTEERFEKLLGSVYEHCRVLYEVSPRLWPRADHNHYLMENLGLLSFACLFSDLKGAEEWKEHALRELERCIDVQVTECGGQIEGCPSYHNGCVYWFSLELNLAAKYGFPVTDHYRERLKKMFAHSVYATRPCGGNSPWGDSHTALKETMALAAVACYLAFSDISYLQVARFFYPMETIMEDLRFNLWRARDLEGLAASLKALEPKAPAQPLFSWQRDLQQVYFRTAWDKQAISVMTACRTPVQNQHAHMDPGGFDMTAYGEPLVCDPGIYTYKDCPERRWFKGIHWHNCLSVNGKDPWEYRGSWEYGPQKEGRILFAGQSSRAAWAVSEHRNYEPAVCRRAVALLDGRFLLVLDSVTGLQAGDFVQLQFHLDRTRIVSEDGAVSSADEGRSNVRILFSGSEEPEQIAAKISTGNDRWHDSTLIRYRQTLPEGGWSLSAALLLPIPADGVFPEAERPQVRLVGEEAQVSFLLDGKPYCVRLGSDSFEVL